MNAKIYTIILILSTIIICISCAEKKDPLSVSTHPEGWNNAQSLNFHGKLVLESYANAENCQSCHGVDYSGGTSNVSCSADGCHNLYPHSLGFADSLSDNFHSKTILNSQNWDITVCQSCHGSDYDGDGYDKKNCLICHTQADGPEACNTCHGSIKSYAPPEDLSGNTLTSAIGVGAHQTHLNDTTWTTAFQQGCSLCHNEPSSLSDVGHIDNVPLPAEIHFGLAASDTGFSNPIWDNGTASCQNIYCHGAFEFNRDSSANSWGYTDQFIRGNDPTMTWTSVGVGQDSCGTCHDLPPQGHTAATTCNGCHPRVVDANFNIINKNLHINGQKEVF